MPLINHNNYAAPSQFAVYFVLVLVCNADQALTNPPPHPPHHHVHDNGSQIRPQPLHGRPPSSAALACLLRTRARKVDHLNVPRSLPWH
ncbi:hypothetical protein EDC01DRAFT_427434 [Geopyxis carbonaria]|nr:hypothetical protein EDC01DRAFT_427434 [Geopyxis carbonaria]